MDNYYMSLDFFQSFSHYSILCHIAGIIRLFHAGVFKHFSLFYYIYSEMCDLVVSGGDVSGGISNGNSGGGSTGGGGNSGSRRQLQSTGGGGGGDGSGGHGGTGRGGPEFGPRGRDDATG